ncbi:MAG: thiol-activated cytolysin family protein [Pseudomonadota bacterium]
MKRFLLFVVVILIGAAAGLRLGFIPVPDDYKSYVPDILSPDSQTPLPWENAEVTNVALGKLATQSSNYTTNPDDARGGAALAVDGNTGGVYDNTAVTHTAKQVNPWWEVDLGAVYDISEIKIWNRTDCCRERLNGTMIYAGETPIQPDDTRLIATIANIGEDDSRTFTVNTRARYVRLIRPLEGYVSVAEVEIFGVPARGSRDTPSEPDTKAFASAANQIVRISGKPAPQPKDKKSGPTKRTETSADGKMEYDYETFSETDNITSVLNLGLNDDVIWPGNMIRGDKIHRFVYNPIKVSREPITISVSLEGSPSTNGPLSTVIENPQLSTVRQGLSTLMSNAIGPETRVPARVDFSKEEVFSEDHMKLVLGADVAYGAGSLETDFTWERNRDRNRVVAKYTQIYFTVDVDAPETPSAFFAPDTPIETLRTQLPQGSHPVYVSSVSYGMMATVFMESNYSSNEMTAALDAAYNNGVVDGKLNISGRYLEILRNSSLKVLVYGGSTDALDSLTTKSGLAGFTDVIASSKTYGPNSPAVPILYKFRSLQDNVLTDFALTSQYTLRRPAREVASEMRLRINKIVCEMADDEGTSNTIEMTKMFIRARSANDKKNKGWRTLYDWKNAERKFHHEDSNATLAVNRDTVFLFPMTGARSININADFLEYDPTGDDERAKRTITVTADPRGGEKSFYMNSSDFSFKVYYSFEPVL